MMKKLILTLILITIGLSNTGCDPEEAFEDHFYHIVFFNASSKTINLKNYGRDTITVFLEPNDTIIPNFTYDYDPENIDNPKLYIEDNIDLLFNPLRNDGIELRINDSIIKTWNGSTGYFEGNSPYNYNSWEVLTYDKVEKTGTSEYKYGELIFTITDEDLEPSITEETVQ